MQSEPCERGDAFRFLMSVSLSRALVFSVWHLAFLFPFLQFTYTHERTHTDVDCRCACKGRLGLYIKHGRVCAVNVAVRCSLALPPLTALLAHQNFVYFFRISNRDTKPTHTHTHWYMHIQLQRGRALYTVRSKMHSCFVV